MEKFSSFLEEQESKPYKLVVLTHAEARIRDTKDHPPDRILIEEKAKKLGINIFIGDFVGAYTKKKGNNRLIYSFPYDKDKNIILPASEDDKIEYQKPFECDPENTIIMPRGLGTLGLSSSRYWYDLVHEFELEGYFILNPLEGSNICNSKYMTYLYFLHNNVRTPKTVSITHSEAAELAFKELKTDFPIVLKSSTGTQTGVGVVIVESMRSLKAFIQMQLLYNKYMPIIIQELIETDYDIRVIVCENEVVGAMKRSVIKGDFRSNISLGGKAETIELTDLEISEAIRITKIVKCKLAGVDFIPSKDRENEKPYCLEVNSSVGIGGIEKIVKPSPIETILKKLYDRSMWN